MAAAHVHVVTGPLVIAKDDAGQLQYVYQGVQLPDSIPADECKRLVETGLVERVPASKVD